LRVSAEVVGLGGWGHRLGALEAGPWRRGAVGRADLSATIRKAVKGQLERRCGKPENDRCGFAMQIGRIGPESGAGGRFGTVIHLRTLIHLRTVTSVARNARAMCAVESPRAARLCAIHFPANGMRRG